MPEHAARSPGLKVTRSTVWFTCAVVARGAQTQLQNWSAFVSCAPW